MGTAGRGARSRDRDVVGMLAPRFLFCFVLFYFHFYALGSGAMGVHSMMGRRSSKNGGRGMGKGE